MTQVCDPEAPINMLLAMGISSFLCVFLGCNPQWLYDLLPNGAMGYHPYDATHVITQLEILLFSALAFTLLNLWGKYPPELPSVIWMLTGFAENLGEDFWDWELFSGMVRTILPMVS